MATLATLRTARPEQLILGGLGTRVCRLCRGNKPFSDFYRSNNRMDGYMRECKVCSNTRVEKWVSQNPEKRKEIANKHWRNHRDSHRAYARFRKYGLGRDEYAALVEKHQGRCGICQREEKLTVDHCHATGKIRGLLCGDCNRALGLFRDNDESLLAAAAYIKENRGDTGNA